MFEFIMRVGWRCTSFPTHLAGRDLRTVGKGAQRFRFGHLTTNACRPEYYRRCSDSNLAMALDFRSDRSFETGSNNSITVYCSSQQAVKERLKISRAVVPKNTNLLM